MAERANPNTGEGTTIGSTENSLVLPRPVLTPGDIIQECIMKDLVTKHDGIITVKAVSSHSNRYQNVYEGPGKVVTNCPEAVILGDTTNEEWSDPRNDVWSKTTRRAVHIRQVPPEGFVAYVISRRLTACQYSGGTYLIPLTGDVPVLDYGTAFAIWTERLESEAYAYLSNLSMSKSTHRKLEFAAGYRNYFAPHAARRATWGSVLKDLGVRGSLDRITKSVRTATCKAALKLGWQPSEPKPEYWAGLPAGVVEIPVVSEDPHSKGTLACE